MNVSIQEILTQTLAFAILLFILKRVAWKPILELLDARRHKIASGFDDIEKGKRELDSLRSDYEARLRGIEEEARAKLEKALQEGKRLSREIQDSARNQARDILDKSKEDVELELKKSRALLRQEMAGLVFAATEKLVREKWSDKKDEEMIVKFLKELEETKEPILPK